MKDIAGIIAILSAICFFIVKFISLTDKNRIEYEFLTSEDKIKTELYSYTGVSGYLSFIVTFIYKWVVSDMDLGDIIAFYIESFIIILFLLYLSFKITKWLTSNHHKLKVASKDFGNVYVIKMLNGNYCLCSENPNIEFDNKGDYQIIKMDDVTNSKMTIEKFMKPCKDNSFIFLLKSKLAKNK